MKSSWSLWRSGLIQRKQNCPYHAIFLGLYTSSYSINTLQAHGEISDPRLHLPLHLKRAITSVKMGTRGT